MLESLPRLCTQEQIPPKTPWFMRCNKMQIPAHLFTPVRLNMFSTKRGGGAVGSEAMRLEQSALSKQGADEPSAASRNERNNRISSPFVLFKIWR